MWLVRRCESDSGSHVCRGGLPPLEQRDALYTTRRSRAKLPGVLTAAEEEQDRRGPDRAERKQAREQSERAQRGRIEPPRRGGATPEARLMRRAPRSGTRRGRTAAPGARAGGPRTAGDRERAERKRQRPRSGASGSQPGRWGRRRAAEATGERAPLAKPGRNARAHRRSPAHRPEWAEHGATGPGGGRGAGPRIGRSPLRGAPSAAGTRTGKVRKLSWILGGVERTTTLHSP